MKTIAYKRQLRIVKRSCGLYSVLIERLNKLPKTRSRIIRFPHVFMIMGSLFRLRKQQSWDLLLLLHEFEIIEVIPYQGIRIL